MSEPSKVHVLVLHPGDRFRYQLGGDIFIVRLKPGRKVPGGDREPGRFMAQHADPAKCQVWAAIGFEGCFVYPEGLARDEQEHDES